MEGSNVLTKKIECIKRRKHLKKMACICRMKRKIYILFLLFFIVPDIHASDDKLDSIISIHENDVMISHILDMISKEYGINFSFSKTILPLEKKVNIKAYKQPVRKILDRLFIGTGIRYTSIKKHVVLIFDPEKSTFNPNNKTPEVIIISARNKDITSTHTQQSGNEIIKKDTIQRNNLSSIKSITPLKSIPLQSKKFNMPDTINIDTNILNNQYNENNIHTVQAGLFKLSAGGCYDFYYHSFGIESSIFKSVFKKISFSLSVNLFPTNQIFFPDENYDIKLKQWHGRLNILYQFASFGNFSTTISGGYNYASKTFMTSQYLEYISLYGERKETIYNNKEHIINHGLNTGIMSIYQFHRICFYLKYYYTFSGSAQSVLSSGFVINFHKK